MIFLAVFYLLVAVFFARTGGWLLSAWCIVLAVIFGVASFHTPTGLS